MLKAAFLCLLKHICAKRTKKEKLVVLDGSMQRRLINMRLRKGGCIGENSAGVRADFLSIIRKSNGQLCRDRSALNNGLAFWFFRSQGYTGCMVEEQMKSVGEYIDSVFLTAATGSTLDSLTQPANHR
ncbi:MAG: hypothetical protein K2X81_24305 [Candidatus Obscuribacterales bacterium]|nr:hypothetical protein [Candidatus Obscuribacterales bacterium]